MGAARVGKGTLERESYEHRIWTTPSAARGPASRLVRRGGARRGEWTPTTRLVDVVNAMVIPAEACVGDRRQTSTSARCAAARSYIQVGSIPATGVPVLAGRRLWARAGSRVPGQRRLRSLDLGEQTTHLEARLA